MVDTVASALSRAGHVITSVHSPLAGLRDHVRLIAFAAACIRELNPGQLNRLEPLSRAMRKAGLTISAGEYLRALERLRQRAAEIIEALAPFDALVCPVASTAPPPSEPPDQTLERLEADWDWAQFTYPFNVTGQPALSDSARVSPAASSSWPLPAGRMSSSVSQDTWSASHRGLSRHRIEPLGSSDSSVR